MSRKVAKTEVQNQVVVKNVEESGKDRPRGAKPWRGKENGAENGGGKSERHGHGIVRYIHKNPRRFWYKLQILFFSIYRNFK